MVSDKNLRIFLADDDEDDREFFRLALKTTGRKTTVTEAHDGADVIAHFRSCTSPPHFVFLDINMPLITGIECLREIRKSHPAELLPVIMLSTSRSPEMMDLSFECGANFYLQKPGKISLLADQLSYCFEQIKNGVSPQQKFLINN